MEAGGDVELGEEREGEVGGYDYGVGSEEGWGGEEGE